MTKPLPLLTALLLLTPCLASQDRLLGIARDEGGQPVGGVTVEVRVGWQSIATNEFWRQAATPSAVLRTGTTDKDGRFTIPVRRGPLYEVKFKKGGYKTHEVHVYANRPFLGLMQRGTDTAEASGPKPDRSQGIVGVLTDRTTGKPITGAVFRKPWAHAVLARPDEKGGFLVPWTKKTAEDLVIVVASGYRIGSLPKGAFVPGKKTTVNLRLEPGITVSGRIVDTDGKPLVGQTVLVDSDIFVTESHTYSGIAWTTKTDAAGRYRFAELAPKGRFWVRTLLPDGTPLELGQGALGEKPVDLGTARTGPRTSVRGKVRWQPKTLIRDYEGKQHERNGPVVDGRVHVLRLFDEKIAQWLVARETPHWPIDATGFYQIPGLCPGKYELGFWAPGAEMEVRVVEARAEKGGEKVIDVALGAGRRFAGKVVDAEGKPVDRALVRGMAWSKDEYLPLVPPTKPLQHNGRYLVGNVRVLTRPDGTFLLERVRSYLPIRLTVQKEGYEKQTIRVEVDAEPPEKIVLQKRQ